MQKAKLKNIILIIATIIIAVVIVFVGCTWFIASSRTSSYNDFKNIETNTQCSIRQETKSMDKIPPNWNNVQMINSQYYPKSLKKPMYFQLINNPYQTFVATKWQWCKTIPKFYKNKPGVTGEWKIVNYHKTSKNMNLKYRWKDMPTYVTYKQNQTNKNDRSKLITAGSPVKYKQGTCGSFSN